MKDIKTFQDEEDEQYDDSNMILEDYYRKL